MPRHVDCRPALSMTHPPWISEPCGLSNAVAKNNVWESLWGCKSKGEKAYKNHRNSGVAERICVPEGVESEKAWQQFDVCRAPTFV